jgi:hypothetical protein
MLPLARNEITPGGNVIRQGIEFDAIGWREKRLASSTVGWTASIGPVRPTTYCPGTSVRSCRSISASSARW